MLVLKRKLAIKKLLQAIKFIEKLGVKIIGLGAFVPIITENGKIIKNKVKWGQVSTIQLDALLFIR